MATVDFQLCQTEQAMTSGVWDDTGSVWTCAGCGARRVFADYENDGADL